MTTQMSPWLRSARAPMLLAMIPSAIFIVALLYFTGWVIAYSFTNLELIGPMSVNAHWIGLSNYIKLFTRQGFLSSLWTTVVFTFFSAIVGQSIIGFLLASALRNRYFFGRSAVEVALMLGWLLPDVVAAFLWSATSSDTGLVNALLIAPFGFKPINFINNFALPVVIVANVWKGTAWSYLLFSAALDAVPREVIEATRVDGANPLQRVTQVILPMIRAHIATNTLFITIWTFTYFPLIYALTGGGPGNQTEVLSVFMYHQSFGVGELGLGSAISVAMMLVVALLSLFYLRQLKEPR